MNSDIISNPQLLDAIMHFDIGPVNAELSFEKRLAVENNWSVEYARQAIIEYKKFIYLIATTNTPKTPSDAVDQVWHLHLTYTKSYWDDFCRDTVNKAIHHGPTKGGSNEATRYREQYLETLANYQSVFGSPPEDIWPDCDSRFSPNIRFRRIDMGSTWMIKKPSKSAMKWLYFMPFPLVLSACAFTGDGGFPLVLMLSIAVAIALLVMLVFKTSNKPSRNNKHKDSSSVGGYIYTGSASGKSKDSKSNDSDSSDSSGSDGAGCGSGCGGG